MVAWGMKYELETIPVWDGFREAEGCPVCTRQAKLEVQYRDFFLGNSVMVPEMRVQVNEVGFCRRHWAALYAGGNKLGLALLAQTRQSRSRAKLRDLYTTLEKDRPRLPVGFLARLFPARRAAGSAITLAARELERCMLCDRLGHGLGNFLYTITKLLTDDEEFQAEFSHSAGLCRPHELDLLSMVTAVVAPRRRRDVLGRIAELQEGGEEERANLLEQWVESFDYRHDKKLNDTARASLLETLRFLAGERDFPR